MKKNQLIKTMEPKYIDIKEFREKGYLQELNRTFLHPLGLALEIIMDDDGTEKLSVILDYREDDAGIYYDIKNSESERKQRFKDNAEFIMSEYMKRSNIRQENL